MNRWWWGSVDRNLSLSLMTENKSTRVLEARKGGGPSLLRGGGPRTNRLIDLDGEPRVQQQANPNQCDPTSPCPPARGNFRRSINSKNKLYNCIFFSHLFTVRCVPRMRSPHLLPSHHRHLLRPPPSLPQPRPPSSWRTWPPADLRRA